MWLTEVIRIGMKTARNVFVSLLRNITVITTQRHPFSYLSEAPGVQSPGTACTLPGPISPPLDLRGTARVSCLRLLAHSLQDTPRGETHDEYAWKTSLLIVGGIVHVETGRVTDSGPRHTPGLVGGQENQTHLVSHHHLPERNIALLWGSLPESFWGVRHHFWPSGNGTRVYQIL